MEFKSGPQWLETKDLDISIKSPRQEVRIPFKGPGTVSGLEREVVVYVTIEGGPDTWGMISMY